MQRIVGLVFASVAAVSLSGCMMAGGMAGMPAMHGVAPTHAGMTTTRVAT